MVRVNLELEGHLIDSLILPKVLDLLVAAGVEYRLTDVTIGRTATDLSRVLIEMDVPVGVDLDPLLEELQVHGANLCVERDCALAVADTDGVLPSGFYSTTNLQTAVRVDGRWIEVIGPEMDCAVVVSADRQLARTVPMHRIRRGDLVVIGREGVRVDAPDRPRGVSAFEFMGSDVSSEKPQALLVRRVADRLRAVREAGLKVLVVAGPAVIHTGGGEDLARLVADGWVDVLFAGNGFATHDIESNVFGTSLGVSLDAGTQTEGGHSNHLRVINEVRRLGSIAATIDAGYVTKGVMYECIRRGVPFVLAGSVRDDGPLPDTITDVVEAADRMRELVPGVGAALMLASTLHAIATGNLLPASVETFCVDINMAVSTKLSDRGSQQALGIVTDVGLFLRRLAGELL
ncbi:MAG: TIGR00300 family protein [Acidimicrobiales bacterium]|nr:TIGR00300 family protein [Acidimicrobiales bacterium]